MSSNNALPLSDGILRPPRPGTPFIFVSECCLAASLLYKRQRSFCRTASQAQVNAAPPFLMQPARRFDVLRTDSQRVKDLSAQVREFVAIQSAQVIPLSARTGHGLDNLRTSLAAALGCSPTASEPPTPSIENPESPKLEPLQEQRPADSEAQRIDDREVATIAAEPGVVSDPAVDIRAEDGTLEMEVVMAKAPEDAATATVLDYVSSAKTGKVLVSVAGMLVTLIFVAVTSFGVFCVAAAALHEHLLVGPFVLVR